MEKPVAREKWDFIIFCAIMKRAVTRAAGASGREGPG